MKRRTFLFLTILLVFLSFTALFASNWRHFFEFPWSEAIIQDGDSIIVATENGLLSVNQTTNTHHYYNSDIIELQTNSIQCLATNTNGVIWAGTDEGLLKIVGNNWQLYNTGNSGIPGDDIRSLLTDSQGHLWIGTNNGLARFNGVSEWLNITTPTLPSPIIMCIYEDLLNNVWVGTMNGLVCYNGTSWYTYSTQNSVLPSNYVQSVCCSDQGVLWIGTSNGLVSKNGDTWNVYQTSNSNIPVNFVSNIVCASGNTIWTSYRNNVYRYNNGSWTVYNHTNSQLPTRDISDLYIDDSDVLWVVMKGVFADDGTCITGGGSLWSFNGNLWIAHDVGYLPDNEIHCVGVDHQQNMWVGFEESGGFGVYNGQNWAFSLTIYPQLPNAGVNCFAFDNSGNTWIGTYQGGLWKINSQGYTIYTAENSDLPDNTIESIAVDSNNNLWISTWGGFVKFDGLNFTAINISSEYIEQIVIDAQCNFWYVPWSNLYGLDGVTLLDHYGSCNCIALDSQDRIWIGTYDGFYIYDDGNITHYTSQDLGVSLDYINSIAFDNEGNAWIGTGDIGNNEGSLIKYNMTTPIVYSTSNSELRGAVTLIAIDNNNNKWIGTDNGLCVFNEDGVPNTDNALQSVKVLKVINYPNPFNPNTTIEFTNPAQGQVELTVYNIKGQMIKQLCNRNFPSGKHSITWDGLDKNGNTVSSGMYFCRVVSNKSTAILKMIMMK